MLCAYLRASQLLLWYMCYPCVQGNTILGSVSLCDSKTLEKHGLLTSKSAQNCMFLFLSLGIIVVPTIIKNNSV